MEIFTEMRNYREIVKEYVQDPEEVSEYLRISLEEYKKDGNLNAFLKATITVTDARRKSNNELR